MTNPETGASFRTTIGGYDPNEVNQVIASMLEAISFKEAEIADATAVVRKLERKRSEMRRAKPRFEDFG